MQWATDPTGRRFWIQEGPVIGRSGWRASFSQKPAPPEIRGVVTVTRVEGDERTEVFEAHCDTLDEARAKIASASGWVADPPVVAIIGCQVEVTMSRHRPTVPIRQAARRPLSGAVSIGQRNTS